MKDNKDTDLIYAVMRLNTHVSDQIAGKDVERKIEGIIGFLPCFGTLKDAEANSSDGKYSVIAMKIIDQQDKTSKP